MITSTDHPEVATLATLAGLADHRGTKPGSTQHDLAVFRAAAYAPSDCPAAELPDYNPTDADLLAIELFSDAAIDELVAAANTYSAYEATRRDRLGATHTMPSSAHPTTPLTSMERAA